MPLVGVAIRIVQIASETDSVRAVEIRNYSGWERGYGRLRNVVGITTRRSMILSFGICSRCWWIERYGRWCVIQLYLTDEQPVNVLTGELEHDV